MLKFLKQLIIISSVAAFTSQAAIINDQIILGEFEGEFGGGYYTITNNTHLAITEFGVTTGQGEFDNQAIIDDFYPYLTDNAEIAYSGLFFDYYLADAWSAKFYEKNEWDITFASTHGSYVNLFGEEENAVGVNWYYFDQEKFNSLLLDTQASDFYINAGTTVGDQFGSYFRFGGELLSNFAAFNSGASVQLIDTGSANETFETPVNVPEPSSLIWFIVAVMALLFLSQRNQNQG